MISETELNYLGSTIFFIFLQIHFVTYNRTIKRRENKKEMFNLLIIPSFSGLQFYLFNRK